MRTLPFLIFLFLFKPGFSQITDNANEYMVSWDTPGKDYKSSMPIGNGDLGLNLWTEENGDLVLLLSKADAWTENGQLVKLGRVRIKLDKPLFAKGLNFKQQLLPKLGEIRIFGDKQAIMKVWVDANAPVIHIKLSANEPVLLTAKTELWRLAPRQTRNKGLELAGQGSLRELNNIPDGEVTVESDSILNAHNNQVSWLHYNKRSIYPLVFKNQHLESLLAKYPDPLINLVFGTVMKGDGLVSKDYLTLTSAAPQTKVGLNLYSLTQQGSVESWKGAMGKLIKKSDAVSLEFAREKHKQWWARFWNRSWINVAGDDNADRVTMGYAMQRWMMAACGRTSTVKYNGGLFTVGQEPAPGTIYNPARGQIDADFRGWGGNYWFQNTRLLYWPTIAAGDNDLLMPFMKMYAKALPLAKDRTALYYHHSGASFIETIYFWGLPNNADFGWNNTDITMQNTWIRHYVSGGLELIAMALSEFQNTGDEEFLKYTLLPLAKEITKYYDQHWPRVNGKIKFDPAQALETRQQKTVNPAPDIAGLKYILPQLMALPDKYTSLDERKMWQGILRDLPPLPLGRTDSSGKQPQFSSQQLNAGKEILLDAEEFVKAKNVENPALYSIFPFTLYGVNLPQLPMAINTFNARLFPGSTCWTQDGIQAAVLGLTIQAKKEVIANFTTYGNERFKWFWAKGHDWEPDLDNGGAGQVTLQSMLMQTRNNQVLLFPAWPKEWDVNFKLHAPQNTTIEGIFKSGKIINLKVYPENRRKDIIICNDFG